MGFWDVLAAGVEGVGDIGSVQVVKVAAERAARTPHPQDPSKPKRKPMPWEKFAGASPCAQNARADYIQKAAKEMYNPGFSKAARSGGSGSTRKAVKVKRALPVARKPTSK
jgi:hypothetical protein